MIRGFFLTFLFCILGFAASAKFEVPSLSGPVVDEVGLLSGREKRQLAETLYETNRSGKAQIQVLIIGSLKGEPIEQASIQIVEQWKLGDKSKDNGILFLIAFEDRKMRIEVGQGLEGAIPDLRAKRILDSVVKPLFKERNYGKGVMAGVYEILQLVDAEMAQNHQDLAPSKGNSISAIILFVLLIFIFLSRFLTGGGRYRRGGGFYGGGFGGGGLGGGWSGGGGGFSGGGASSDW